jgi:hypothetical protein
LQTHTYQLSVHVSIRLKLIHVSIRLKEADRRMYIDLYTIR